MPNFVLYDLEYSEFHGAYEGDVKKEFGGKWGDGNQTLNVQIPDGIDYRKYNLDEVTLGDGQTEDDIDFDHKHEYTNGFVSQVSYWKFNYNNTKGNDIDAQDAALAVKEAKDAKKLRGKLFKDLAGDIYDIMKAHCFDNGLTTAQIEQVKTENATVFQLLQDEMPVTAKPLVDALVADGTLITQAMLDDIALEYQEFADANPDITIP